MARVLIWYILPPPNPISPFLHSHYFTCSPSPFSPLRHRKPQQKSLDLPHRILDGFKQCRTSAQLSQIHALQITSGYAHMPFFAAKLLNLSAEIGNLNYTLMNYRKVGIMNRVCVNAVIRAYSASSLAIQGVAFYFQMLKVTFSVTSFTFPPLLRCCVTSGCAVSGRKCHGQAIKKGFDDAVEIQNSLIHMYGCFGLIDMASRVFNEMSDRDLVS